MVKRWQDRQDRRRHIVNGLLYAPLVSTIVVSGALGLAQNYTAGIAVVIVAFAWVGVYIAVNLAFWRQIGKWINADNSDA